MPYKFNEPRRHKIPTAKYRVTNWPDYDAALVRRGALTVWFTDAAIAAWRAPATGRRGGQPIYSALAIETALTIRLVFHQPLRQTEGLLRSIADVLGVDIAIPDHTTLSRRGVGLTVLPRDIDQTEPLHLVVDSTGLKIYGEGEWLDAKHGSRSRRRWRKLHIGINAETHDVVVAELTPDDVGDVSAVPDLLEQIDGRVASLTADGAYDGGSDEPARPAYCNDCTAWSNRLAASIGLQSKEPRRDSSLPLQDHHRPTTLRSESTQSADRDKDRMQCTQSNDAFGYASLRSGEVTEGTKMQAEIAAHSRRIGA
jgi:hypothetical protein